MRLEADPTLFTSTDQCEAWIRTEFKKDLLFKLRGVMGLRQQST